MLASSRGGVSGSERAAYALVRAGLVTCLLLWPARSVHVVKMASSPAPERLIRLFPGRQPWPRQVFASSVALHALGFALAGWATHVKFRTLISTSPQHVTRSYAVHYLVLNRPQTRPEPRPEPRPPRPLGPVASVSASATPPGSVSVVNIASQSAPRRPALQA